MTTQSFNRAIIIALLFSFFACNKNEKVTVDPAFRAYITAFTTGTISSTGKIYIQLVNDIVKATDLNTTVEKKLFEFSPSIDGNAVWVNENTIEFRPSAKMEPGRQYKASFKLAEVMKVPAKFSKFEFNFQIIQQSFEVNVEGLHAVDNRNFDHQYLSGNLVTADIADAVQVEKILTASQNNISLPIKWKHSDGNLIHNFTVDSIIREKDSSSVILSWNGKSINVDKKGNDTITVPALGDFILMDTRVVQQETDQYLMLQFSDPLDETQNLQGLIQLGALPDLRFVIEGNMIRVYPPSRQSGSITLVVDAAIKNGMGKTMTDRAVRTILFEEVKPLVRLSGKGVILPSSGGIVFPFEAVNLSAVDVKVVKIFAENVSQFLQVNSINEGNEITRVGRVVLNKTILLSSIKQTDLKRWNQYALDLGTLVRTDPGSIYRITISFRKKHSLYICTENDSTADEVDNNDQNWDDLETKESSSWDYVEDYYENNENYQWSNRDNPCKKEYYSANKAVSRNVLASDIGLIAKKGMDGSMLFVVTDLKSANPLPGVNLEVYNLQKQIIQNGITNSDGMLTLTTAEKPFLLVAKRGIQRGYLKLDDGSSLSMSMFDVAGEKVQKGVKGFIYGERGVWRPGDSLYFTFILQDKQHTLPESHPVSFELYNPMGQLSKRMISTTSNNGFYSFHTSTGEDDPTGNWEAKVKVGGVVFTKPIRIETVMPNRLKIKFDFPKQYLAADVDQSAVMEVKWLHGAIARNLKATVEASLTAASTTFPKYSEYTFDDPTRKFSADKQELFNGSVDELGRASVKADIVVEEAAPGILQANFVTKVFEPGGSFSIDRFSLPYHPYESYVGLRTPPGDKARGMLLTDTNHTVSIVCVDRNGKPVTGKRKVEIEFYQIKWKWWWDKSAEDLSDYNSTQWQRIISRDTVTLENGEGKWTLRLNYPEWGRYLLRVCDSKSGHCAGKTFYMDWPGWAGRAQRDNQGGGATMLTFSSDKDKYQVGDEATITIPSSSNSRALISIESGTRVLQSDWLVTKQGESRYKFKITPEMTPNIYVNVTLLQPHSQTLNDLPIRLYGIIPIQVENPGTHLQPIISMPNILKPEENFKVDVREEKGRAMTYTIAMVDEGLLDLTRYKTPDPWNSFYAREALGVKSWDLFDDVMGAWGAKLERILSIGGDEGLSKPKEGKKANRFKPVVRFLGPFHLGKGQSASHMIDMPQYIGSVRTMVIAAEDGAYGFAEKATPVRKPLMVLATMPRVLGPGETAEVPVSVFALENNVKDVTVEIIASNIFTSEKENKQTTHFNMPGDEVVNFRLKTKALTGVGTVKIVATSGSERAETMIELNVMNRNPKLTVVRDTVLQSGQTWTSKYMPVGIAGTNVAIIEASSIPPLNLGKRLDYLIHYPYGCIEQTTSSVFPQLYLADLMDLSSAKKSATETNIKAGIERLKLFQLSSGGISYWPGEKEENDYATNYAGHFLIEAEMKGYIIPAAFMEQWKKYQHNKAQSWSFTDWESGLTQAYRLYTLALIKSPEPGSMNRMREIKTLPDIAKWTLAAAYQISGQPEVANKLIENLPMGIKNYRELGGTFGSDERDEAIILETLSLMDRKSQAAPVMKRISESLCSKEWMSTHTTAMMLLSMSKFIGRTKPESQMNFAYQVNTNPKQNITSTSMIKQVDMKMKGTTDGIINVTNTGGSILFVRIISEGIPTADDQTSTQNGIDMKIAYKSADGKDIDPVSISQGTDFYAEVSMTNLNQKENYQQMALNQIFPSGWEIMNSRLDQTATSSKTSEPTFLDIRDDRVYTFFNINAKETKTFRVYLNASYLGKYYLPSVSCEAMYDASINSRRPGKWVEVIAGEKPSKALSKK